MLVKKLCIQNKGSDTEVVSKLANVLEKSKVIKGIEYRCKH